eukprot:11334141-Alexandrium_andersonii.AAC.1
MSWLLHPQARQCRGGDHCCNSKPRMQVALEPAQLGGPVPKAWFRSRPRQWVQEQAEASSTPA